jgi:dihydroorotate dehydrogenase
MNRFWSAAQATLLFLEPETAHDASLRALEAGVHPRQAQADDPRLAQTLFGLTFPNPVGVAAGFDKDARVYNALFDIGFGFAEAGTITPKPQRGNPRPRVFRLMRERGIINRLGFNSGGHSAAVVKLASRPPRGIIGSISARTVTAATPSRTMLQACTLSARWPRTSRSISPHRTRRACATCKRLTG